MAVSSMQIPSEITRLAKVVDELKPKLSMEIGTAHGGTLLVWSQLTSEEVIACDINNMSNQGCLFSRFPPPQSKCKITLISGDSHSARLRNEVELALNDRKLDFLYIDGDHTAEGVCADYENFRTLVRPGGIIAFHDIVEKQSIPTNQVGIFWQRLKCVAQVEEIIDNPNQVGYGIGILRVPSAGAPSTI